MDLRQLRVFREVMRTGSISQAARNLDRTQPAVSHMIARLEEELGVTLFERRRGRLYAVPEAQYLLRESEELLGRATAVRQTMQRMKALEAGELSVISMPGPAAVLLPALIGELVGPHPEIKATLLTRSSDAIVQLAGTQQFDLAIADHDPARRINADLLHTETHVFDSICAVPGDDPLARAEAVTPGDLSGLPMAALYPEHLSHRLARRAFEAAGADFSVRFFGQFFLPLLSYVAHGLARVIVDPLTAESWIRSTNRPGAVVFRRFRPEIAFGVDVMRPAYRPESLLAHSFLAHLRGLFAELGGRQEPPAG
ncbi:LysR family transcriptional regulator [Paralimibaculum aggregatum]|uniref:LysR family transcriptional regulator n=1 Tax=Paralimibaculum aggregatum TaxID=3036245 RepID=A0ABQ6LRQ2_9RHOB|nr:LysR family transcriptional regulator [Limibaculum sp. NKW23]GMG83935.1 LysR family transcriptional regulator [Limibaculum sp. NKW23]